MDVGAVRTCAKSLPAVVEAPHFDYASFRVGGRIFISVPPDGRHAHFFLAEDDRERALALHPGFVEKLWWGSKVVGIRVALADADPAAVDGFVRQAWRNKAPRKVLEMGGG